MKAQALRSRASERPGAETGRTAPSSAGSSLAALAESIRTSPVMQARAAATRAMFGTALDTPPVQRAARPNRTGLPDRLKANVEALSGFAMDDVRVHRNSSKPAQLQAHAYAQGTEIHLASGQEKHLPHEAWHVVQQKQGRVRPTMQLKGVESASIPSKHIVQRVIQVGSTNYQLTDLQKMITRFSIENFLRSKEASKKDRIIKAVEEELKPESLHRYQSLLGAFQEIDERLHGSTPQRDLPKSGPILPPPHVESITPEKERVASEKQQIIRMDTISLDDRMLPITNGGLQPTIVPTVKQPSSGEQRIYVPSISQPASKDDAVKGRQCYIYATFAAVDYIRQRNGLDTSDLPDKLQTASDDNRYRMGGGSSLIFRKNLKIGSREYDVAQKKETREAINRAIQEKLPMTIAVQWRKGNYSGNHWMYVTDVRGNTLFAKDQQNGHLNAEIDMKSWEGRSVQEGRDKVAFDYEVKKVVVAQDTGIQG